MLLTCVIAIQTVQFILLITEKSKRRNDIYALLTKLVRSRVRFSMDRGEVQSIKAYYMAKRLHQRSSLLRGPRGKYRAGKIGPSFPLGANQNTEFASSCPLAEPAI